MSREPNNKFRLQADELREQMRIFYEPQLISIGLGEDLIKNQTLDELYQSLERVNDAINNPDAFGRLALKVSGSTGAFIVATTAESSIEILAT